MNPAQASQLNYPALYAGVFVLQLVTVLTIAAERMASDLRVVFVAMFVPALAGSLLLGYARRDWVARRGSWIQFLSLLVAAALVACWIAFVGPRFLFIVAALCLLAGRNLVLVTRRALYFDIAIAATAFYDAIGLQAGLRTGLFAVAFLVALVFVLMADYASRRLELVGADDRETRAALAPNLGNAALATALVFFAGLLIYWMLPQPPPGRYGIPDPDAAFMLRYGATSEESGAAARLEPAGSGKGEKQDVKVAAGSGKSGVGAGGPSKLDISRSSGAAPREAPTTLAQGKGGNSSTGAGQSEAKGRRSDSGTPSRSDQGGPGEMDSAPPMDSDPNGRRSDSGAAHSGEGDPGKEGSPSGASREPKGEHEIGSEAKHHRQAETKGGTKGDDPKATENKDKKQAKDKRKDKNKGGSDLPLVLMLVDSPHPAHVRTRVYSVPRTREWEESRVRPVELPGTKGRFSLRSVQVHEPLLQHYEVMARLPGRIPAVYRAEHLGFPAHSIAVDSDGILHSGEGLRVGTRYSVLSRVEYFGSRPAGGIQPEGAFAFYRALPAGLPPQIAQEARRHAGRSTAPRDKAAALEARLRREYQIGRFEASDRDPTTEFLFEQKRGTSEQFASALALMLRASGIPARVAEGYQMRRYNPLRGRYEIWKSDHHTWVEAFVDDRWTVYEPSPWASLPARNRDQSSWESAREYVRLARTNDAGEPVLPPDRPNDGYLWQVLAWGWMVTFGPWILLAFACAALLAGRHQRWVRPLLDLIDRYRLSRAGTWREQVLAAYAVAESALARRDLRRVQAETHSEYFARVAASRPHLRAPLAHLGACFSVARYSQSPPDRATAEYATAACREILELVDETPAR